MMIASTWRRRSTWRTSTASSTLCSSAISSLASFRPPGNVHSRTRRGRRTRTLPRARASLPYSIVCGVQPDVEMNTNSCMSSVSTETADTGTEGTFSREEWDSFSSQCIMKTSTHRTWLFPQYFAYVKVASSSSPHRSPRVAPVSPACRALPSPTRLPTRFLPPVSNPRATPPKSAPPRVLPPFSRPRPPRIPTPPWPFDPVIVSLTGILCRSVPMT